MNIFILMKTPDNYRSDMDDNHDLVVDNDSDTLIRRIGKFLKQGKAPGPDNIRSQVLKLGPTTPLFITKHGFLPTPYK